MSEENVEIVWVGLRALDQRDELAGVYPFEDGNIRRAHISLDREAALEAAGLPE